MSSGPPTEHTINLGSAWQRTLLNRSDEVLAAGRVRLPDATVFTGDVEQAIYQRSFNRPSGLDSTSRVYLECGLFAAGNQAFFNDDLRSDMASTTIVEITNDMQAFNTLRIVIERANIAIVGSASAMIRITRS